MRRFADANLEREPNVLVDVIGYMDGLDIDVQNDADALRQNANYNGYGGRTIISNIFVFAPTGCIIWAALNAAGTACL
jgi:hypothetical protein